MFDHRYRYCCALLLVFVMVGMHDRVEAANGLSISMLTVPSAATLAPGTLELAPTFQYGWVGEEFGNVVFGPKTPYATAQTDSQSNIRMSVGITSNWEVGAQLPLVAQWQGQTFSFFVENLDAATKIGLYKSNNRKVALAALIGVQIPLMGDLWGIKVGPVLDYRPTRWLLFNVSGGVSVDWQQTATVGLRYDFGAGFFVWPEIIQLVVEWRHRWHFSDPVLTEATLGFGLNAHLHPAVTLRAAASFDLFGANLSQNFQVMGSVVIALGLRRQRPRY